MTDLQTRYEHRFHQLDENGDGRLTRDDFVQWALRTLNGLDEPLDSPKARTYINVRGQVWESLTERAGTDADGHLTKQDFVDVIDAARASGTLIDIFGPSIAAHVALMDRDGDGEVGLMEFIAAQNGVGIPADLAREAFAAMDRNGDGSLSADELCAAVEAFYTSDEQDLPGALVLNYSR